MEHAELLATGLHRPHRGLRRDSAAGARARAFLGVLAFYFICFSRAPRFVSSEKPATGHWPSTFFAVFLSKFGRRVRLLLVQFALWAAMASHSNTEPT